MKVLHLIHNYHPSVGGSQDLFRHFSERLVSRWDDAVTVLTTDALRSPHSRDPGRVGVREEWINGVRVRRFRFARASRALNAAARVNRRLGLPWGEGLSLWSHGPVAPGMLLETITADADIVGSTSSPYLHTEFPRWARRLGRRRPHVLFGALHLNGSPIPRRLVRAVAAADAYVAYTAAERDALAAAGAPPERMHVVGLGVEAERFEGARGDAVRARLGLGSDPLVAFVGRLAPYKGVGTLVEAMSEVWKAVPEARLLIAGARTPYAETLDRMIDALPPARRERVARVEDFSDAEKPALFAAADVFVNPSREESFGIVFLEAWAAGKPVVGGRIPAVESVVREGEDGLLVPCGDAPALAASLTALLRDDALRARMGEAGRERVRRDHGWDRVTGRLRDLYAGLAGAGG